MRTNRTDPRQGVTPWSRQRLQAALAGVAVLLFVLAASAAMLLVRTPAANQEPGTQSAGTARPTAESSDQVKDRIAAEPMLSLDAEAATQPDPATEVAGYIWIPEPITGRGPAGLPVFGHTSEGAVAQLAAIDQAVLEAMSIPVARDVHTAWVLPAGPTFDEWDLTVNVAAFLRGARQGATKDLTTIVTATPAGGLVKGAHGPDWAVACVLLDVRASIRADYRMGWGHCHRMQWTDGRWQVAPGAQPAKAPSAWPGSKSALAAGWSAWSPVEGSGR